jgi:hypothetical protein
MACNKEMLYQHFFSTQFWNMPLGGFKITTTWVKIYLIKIYDREIVSKKERRENLFDLE